LRLARERLAAGKSGAGLVTLLTATVYRLGSPQERTEILDRAKGEERGAMAALEAVAAAAPGEVATIYDAARQDSVKAAALSALAAGPERDKWLEDGLSAARPEPVRLAAVALLDGNRPKERSELMRVTQAESSPALRERALRSLGALGDKGLQSFFQSIAAQDTEPAIRSLAASLAAGLDE
jgi:hypothetical protein